jgi:hypothetical protein
MTEKSWRVVWVVTAVVASLVLLVYWVRHVRIVTDWLQVHTGTVDEPGQYYAFWSGFGSDLAEFGILGAAATAVYHLVKKWNCHEPGCWRIGNHSAAGGQFNLCYLHHPDYRGRHPTHELIQRLHREHLERQAAMSGKLEELHERLAADAHRGDGPPAAGS